MLQHADSGGGGGQPSVQHDSGQHSTTASALRRSPREDLEHFRNAVVSFRFIHEFQEHVRENAPYQRAPRRQLGVQSMHDRFQIVSAVREE